MPIKKIILKQGKQPEYGIMGPSYDMFEVKHVNAKFFTECL
jgi:hypothetical protein